MIYAHNYVFLVWGLDALATLLREVSGESIISITQVYASYFTVCVRLGNQADRERVKRVLYKDLKIIEPKVRPLESTTRNQDE